MYHHKIRLPMMALGSVLLLSACWHKSETSAASYSPKVAQVTPVPYGNDTTPNYTFSSNEAGTITYGGDCASATTAATSGNNTITFTALDYGIYDNCTIKVIDAVGNQSNTLVISSFSVASKPYNDTGITLCGDYAYGYGNVDNNTVDCAGGASPSATTTSQGTEIDNGLDPVPAGQDAVYGRDANALTNSDNDGHKGFSFTKLQADGMVLLDQSQPWSFDGGGFDNGTEAGGTNWSCIKDNVTGLIWEVKTNKSPEDYRDKDATYTWYNSDGTKNGGYAGTADEDSGSSCFNTGNCDTQKYVAYINSQNLCGASDWRMPSKGELQSIISKHRVNPAIDAAWIPNTVSSRYWSASPCANSNSCAWFVYFDYGFESVNSKDSTYYVRLVRGAY